MRRLLLLVMVFPLLMVSCSRGGKELAAKLHLADSLIEAEPDSGVALLVSLREQVEDASKANRYRYQLLLAKAMNKAYVPFTSDSVMKDVAQYYDHHGSPNERMMAHYLLGCAYRDMGSLPQALLQYEEAISQADTTSEDCDFKTLGRIYGQAADILCDFQQPKDLLEYSRKARRFALMGEDTLSAISAYEHMADAYEILEMPDSEIAISEKTSRMYLAFGYREWAASALAPIIDDYVSRGDLANAKRCIDIYEKESGFFDSNGNVTSGREVYYFQKSRYYIGVSKLDSAIFYLRKLQGKPNLDINERNAVAKGLYELYEKLGNADSTLKYSIIVGNLAEESRLWQMKQSTSRTNAIHKYNALREKADQKERESISAWNILFKTVGLALIVIVFLLYLGKRKDRSLKDERQRAEQNQLLYNQVREDLFQTQTTFSQFKKRTKEKNKRLAQEYGMQVSQLREEITRLCKPHEKAEVENRICGAAIAEKFHKIANSPGQHPSMQDWHELRMMMSEELPEFNEILSNGEPLHIEELDISILIRLRFRLSEISNLTERSLANISVMRRRMLKKVTRKDGSALDYDQFLQNIY